MRLGDLLALMASLMALWLDLRETMESGSSKGGREKSVSLPRGPSGEPWREELLVVSWAVSGDMMGEVCRELEVVTEEALMAEAGVFEIWGRKLVWTWLGLGCLEDKE